MTKRAWMVALMTLAWTAQPSLGIGDEVERPELSLKNPDLHQGMKVKWVFEGCAAYPVEVDELAEEPAEPSTKTQPPASS